MLVLWVGGEFEFSGITGGARFLGDWGIAIGRNPRGGSLWKKMLGSLTKIDQQKGTCKIVEIIRIGEIYRFKTSKTHALAGVLVFRPFYQIRHWIVNDWCAIMSLTSILFVIIIFV